MEALPAKPVKAVPPANEPKTKKVASDLKAAAGYHTSRAQVAVDRLIAGEAVGGD